MSLQLSFTRQVTRDRARKIFQGLRLSYQATGALVGCAEITAIVVASILAQIIYQGLRLDTVSEIDIATRIGLTDGLIYLFLARFDGLYRLQTILNPRRHYARIVAVGIFSLLVLTAVLFLLKVGGNLSRSWFLVFAGLELIMLLSTRVLASVVIRSMAVRGAITGRSAVVIGDANELGRLSAANLLLHFGMKEVGRFTLNPTGSQDDSQDCLPDTHSDLLDKAVAFAREMRAEEFVVAVGWNNSQLLAEISGALRNSPLPARLLPDYGLRSVLGRQEASSTGTTLTVEVQRAPMAPIDRFTKRLFDIVFASIALIILSPTLAFTALIIKFDSPGPVIFRQRRNGFNGHEFVIYKFRTMQVLEDGQKITQATRDDLRVTRFGRLLRRASIDELPQLFNVLKGDMSLVGPRPHALAHDDQYKHSIETYHRRHHVKPGITGWAQVNGLRGETARMEQMQQRVEFDLWYINNWSIWLDLRILIRTCLTVNDPNAY